MYFSEKASDIKLEMKDKDLSLKLSNLSSFLEILQNISENRLDEVLVERQFYERQVELLMKMNVFCKEEKSMEVELKEEEKENVQVIYSNIVYYLANL